MVRDIHHEVLMNQFDYANMNNIRSALAMFNVLEDKMYKGNASAQAIILDINNAMEQLPKIERQCINKYYFEGYTQIEIAWQLNISQRLVSGHITSAIGHIMQVLAGENLLIQMMVGELD